MIIPAGIKAPVIALLAFAAMLIIAAILITVPQPPDPSQPVVKHISAPQYAERKAGLLEDLVLVTRERDGLRGIVDKLHAEILGLKALRPDSIFIPDVQPVFIDTAIVQGSFDIRRGLELHAGVDRDSTGAYAPRIAVYGGGKGCERVVFRGLQAVCQRPRFGHGEIFMRAGVSLRLPTSLGLPDSIRGTAQLGVRWVPSLVSPWAAETSIDLHKRVQFGVERGLHLW